MGPGGLNASMKSTHAAVPKHALTQPCLQLWAPCLFSSQWMTLNDHRATGNPNTLLATAASPGAGKLPEAKCQGPSPAPGAMACLQQPISDPLLPPQAPGWLFHTAMCCSSPLFAGGSGIHFPDCILCFQSTSRERPHDHPPTPSSHPARTPAITQLTKLPTKQPQHLEAGGWQKAPAPGERAPTTDTAGAGCGSRPTPPRGSRQPPPTLQGWTPPAPGRGRPAPLRSPGPRRRHLPPGWRLRSWGAPTAAPRPGAFCRGWVRGPGGVGAAAGGLWPCFAPRRLPPALPGQRGRWGLDGGAEVLRLDVTAGLALRTPSPCLPSLIWRKFRSLWRKRHCAGRLTPDRNVNIVCLPVTASAPLGSREGLNVCTLMYNNYTDKLKSFFS